jgi:gluconokinase
MSVMIIVVMGVAGAGKSTVGQLLAAELRSEFLDADTLHPAANIQKMTQGIPLTDADRGPWLAAIRVHIVESFQRRRSLVIACSALKQRHREILADGVSITWVYLKGSEDVIRARLLERQHHFFKAQMLTSQFADLEEPADAIVVDVEIAPIVAVRQIITALFPVRAQAS